MNIKTLEQLYAEHQGKVSDKWSFYLTEYERLFAEYRARPLRLLEIGVQNGGSLDIWAKYFPQAAILVGCDINPDCKQLHYDDPRVKVIVGDANDAETSAKVLDCSSTFDLIIDDGSHRSSDIVKSFVRYFPHLASDGLFVVEDLHCSYWQAFEGGLFDPYSAITFFKRLADVINYEHWGVTRQRVDILRGVCDHFGVRIDETLLTRIHALEFTNSMCIVRSAAPSSNSLGWRFIAGTEETVVKGLVKLQEQHHRPYRLEAAHAQEDNIWSNRSRPPEETVTELEGRIQELQQQLLQSHELVRSQHQDIGAFSDLAAKRLERLQILRQRDAGHLARLAQLQRDLEQSHRAISALQQSTIWRWTWPLRAVIGAMRQPAYFRSRLRQALERTIAPLPRSIIRRITACWQTTATKESGGASSTRWLQRLHTPAAAIAQARDQKLHVHVDSPRLPLSFIDSNFAISGWALDVARKSAATVRIYVDGNLQEFQTVHREDVRRAFPKVEGLPVELGFTSAPQLPVGLHFLRIDLLLKDQSWLGIHRGLLVRLPAHVHHWLQRFGRQRTEARPATIRTPFVPSPPSGLYLNQPLNIVLAEKLTVRPRINVVLPSLRMQHMSGGPNTALLLAAMLAERGERIRLMACDASMTEPPDVFYNHLDKLLQRTAPRARIELVDASNRQRPVHIGANDLFLATAWWTAQLVKQALEHTLHKTFVYLIQDFESLLHEASSAQAQALETYALPHIPVVNTQLLLDHLQQEKTGRYADPDFVAAALPFQPALDRRYFHPVQNHSRSQSKKVLLFYARPTVAHRNLFEMGLVALQYAVSTGVIDHNHWELWAMGEQIAPVALGRGVTLQPLPWMGFAAYAERIRTADLMLSLMFSPHPSYPPLEMAAAGNLVVTNSYAVKTRERLQAISPNIIVAEPTLECIATATVDAASRINAGVASNDPSGRVDLPSDWDDSLQSVIAALLNRVRDLRADRPPTPTGFVPGLPLRPRTDYEHYRRNRLAARRRLGTGVQESGLLSFITSAYNTDPVFLDALASSVLLQDGGTCFEWLILDNGSTDAQTRETLETIGNHPAVTLERVDENLGIIGGMRYLLDRAHGRYVLPLDSDDIIAPDCVHILTRFIKDNNYPALLYTDEDKLGADGFALPYHKPDWDPVLFLHSCYIAHLCAIDRKLALQLGLYTDPGAEGCHDWDSFIRFMQAGYTPQHVPEVLYSWRMHMASTAGNINSKSYISVSHQNTLQRFLKTSGLDRIELVPSPLFDQNVDWWFKRKRVQAQSLQSIVIRSGTGQPMDTAAGAHSQVVYVDRSESLERLQTLLVRIDTELVHFCYDDVILEGDEWSWDAMGLLEMFPDAVLVGGLLHNGTTVIDGPRVFGFNQGFGCPDKNRDINDGGYGAQLWKPHSVSAVSTAHCVVKTAFLRQQLSELLDDKAAWPTLAIWLSGYAWELGHRVLYSPFMRGRVASGWRDVPGSEQRGYLLARFHTLISRQRVYSSRLGLLPSCAYAEVSLRDNRQHLAQLRSKGLRYPEWLDYTLRKRLRNYPLPASPANLTVVTTIYENTDLGLLHALAESIVTQTFPATEWVIVAHGPIADGNLDVIVQAAKERWHATVDIEPQPLGIMGAMRRGLEQARGDYIVPVDADDLLTVDALQILATAIASNDQPDLVFSDEDLLVDGQPAAPYLRSTFDPVLNLDSSTIWHLCAINRQRALALALYTDMAATWCHDWDSVTRIANAGGRLVHVPEILYHWRQHGGSTTNKSEVDPRSLASVRHVLEQQIARQPQPQRFAVADWPESRGARELYIARKSECLPAFIWAGNQTAAAESRPPDDAIVVCMDGAVSLIAATVFVEVARLFDLHPDAGAVGGLVVNAEGVIIDACYLRTAAGRLVSPWIDKPASSTGPYALASKPQTVAASGERLTFFRLAALRATAQWPCDPGLIQPVRSHGLCQTLQQGGWRIVFSPLVKGVANAGDTGSSKTGDLLYAATGASGAVPSLCRYEELFCSLQ